MAEEKTLVEILDEHTKVDMVKYINYVTAPQCAATATFSGTTRDTFEGKTVVELRYEAYVPMAIRCLKAICANARSSWNLDAIWKKEAYSNGEVYMERKFRVCGEKL